MWFKKGFLGVNLRNSDIVNKILELELLVLIWSRSSINLTKPRINVI